MSRAFCTIVTSDYIGYAHVVMQSLLDQGVETVFNVLVVDEEPDAVVNTIAGMNIFGLRDIQNQKYAKQLIAKYGGDSGSSLRWTLKPIFINYLLEQGAEQVMFVDPDLAFFSSPEFLFQELGHFGVLLTPHWRDIYPERSARQFQLLFKEGLYNAGFIGVSKGGKEAMDWWASACLESCSKNDFSGMYDDQAYLNAMPVYFEKVKSLTHKGCNVASWNQHYCKRVIKGDQVLIDDKYPIVFIHFTPSTIRDISFGRDEGLAAYLETYKTWLNMYNVPFIAPRKKSFWRKIGLS